MPCVEVCLWSINAVQSQAGLNLHSDDPVPITDLNASCTFASKKQFNICEEVENAEISFVPPYNALVPKKN